MIFGIGNDIVEICRIGRIYDDYGQNFLERFFHGQEIQKFYNLSKNKQIAFLAKRFAAKEAFSKAFGTGIRGSVKFTSIAILNDDNGKPFLRLYDKLNDEFQRQIGEAKIHVSLSDEKTHASAFIVIEQF